MALVREADVERSMDSSGHFGLAADSASMRLLLQTAAATLLTSPLPLHLSLTSRLTPLDSIQQIAVNRDNVKMASVSTSARPDMGQWRKNLSAHVICPECREVPPNLEFPDSHETVCGSCGLVLADREIDMHSEWRTFSNDDQNNDDPSRVGDATNPLLNGDQLETQIASGGSGRARELYRAQNKQSSEKANKALLAAYKEIGALCDGFNIQKNVADTAKYLFKIVDDAKAFKGKSQEVIIAGCIFIACRQCKVPRTFTEIFAVTKVTRKEIGRIYKALEKFFTAQNLERINAVVSNGGVPDPNDTYTATTSTKPSDLCNRFCNLLDLPYQVTSVSSALSDRVTTMGDLAGRSPLSIVAACIYMASYLMGHGKSAKEISQVAHVSDGTIRGAYKQLYAERERLIDPEWIKDGKGDMKNLPAS
ncbi:transcription initiation protein [Aspergillus lentulus]|nr:transcription initiation protein [Aspergillus lentulus]GFF46101.1 transcription initiation protein [Aspergillus lentulus]GFG01882.1 transcription initiation protein [Aspergillus lentulus]